MGRVWECTQLLYKCGIPSAMRLKYKGHFIEVSLEKLDWYHPRNNQTILDMEYYELKRRMEEEDGIYSPQCPALVGMKFEIMNGKLVPVLPLNSNWRIEKYV